MGKHKTKIKRLAAFWLSIAMLCGSIYSSNNYTSLADQTGLNLLESFKAENRKGSNSSDSSGGITAVKATAANSGEITDGDVEDDTATTSDADGDVATASNANAIRSLRATVATKVKEEIKSSISYVTGGVTGAIATPGDFAIGKNGTKDMKIAYSIDITNDFKDEDTSDIGAEIVIPYGFSPKNYELKGDDALKWSVEYELVDNNEPYGGGIIKIKTSAHITDTLEASFEILQDAQALINNLSATNEYKFALNLYTNYSTGSPTRLVKEGGSEDETTSFAFKEADNSNPTWTVELYNDGIKNNDIVYSPKDFSTGRSRASEDAYKTYSYLTSNEFDKGIVIKYTKTEGYISDDTIFKFVTEKLPLYNDESLVLVRFIDEYENVVYLTAKGTPYLTPNTVTNGEYTLNAAKMANDSYTDGVVERFTTIKDATPNNSTYADIFYRKGTFEIRVMPKILYNKILYNETALPHIYESNYNTGVVAKSNNPDEADIEPNGTPIKITINSGSQTYSDYFKSASAADSDEKEVNQIGTTKTYNDVTNQSIRLNYSSYSSTVDWKPYNNFSITVNYSDGVDKNGKTYKGALYPVKLESLLTTETNGLTYKIYIKDAKSGNERIETIVGKKNSTEYYPYTPSNTIKETVYRDGRTTWDGTSESTKLDDTEYVFKVEIFKDKVADNSINGDCTLANTTLRAQHHTIDGMNTNIPDSTKVRLESTVKMANVTKGTYVQNITTVEDTTHIGDSLELLKADANQDYLTLQVNNATAENGILGIYTLKKYLLTDDYDSTDPPVVVISGDGATLTDRVGATDQTLMYIVYEENGDDVLIDFTNKKIINLADKTVKNCDVEVSDYVIDVTSSYFESFGGKDISVDSEGNVVIKKEYVTSKNKDLSYTYPYRNLSDSEDNDTKLYNLTLLFGDLRKKGININYAKEIVLSQDYVINKWNATAENGETWSKCFYANAIKPGYLNYDNLIKPYIDGKTKFEDVSELKYKSQLYCKSSDYYNEKVNNIATDSNAGAHGKATEKEQLISKIVYGNETSQFLVMNTKNKYLQGSYLYNPYNANGNYKGSQMPLNRSVTCDANSSPDTCFLTMVGPRNRMDGNDTSIRINDPQIDYDNVTYDFSGTSEELLSITSAVGLYQPWNGGRYLVNIEYTKKDAEGNVKNEKSEVECFLRGGWEFDTWGNYLPLDIKKGEYLTALKVKISTEGYTWSQKRGYDFESMQPEFPEVLLMKKDVTGIIPKEYPSSGNEVGYIGKKTGVTYDNLDVKCTLSYNDIFGNKTSLVATGSSARIEAKLEAYTTFTLKTKNDASNSGFTYKILDSDGNVAEEKYVKRGNKVVATFVPAISLKNQISDIGLKLRPVFYYAIDKNFTPNIKDMKGRESGTNFAFYPAGVGDGYSGSEDYGYLVIDYGSTSESELSVISNYNTTFAYGQYEIPFNVNYDADEGDKTPILFMWADLPHDRDGLNSTYPIDISSSQAVATGTYTGIVENEKTKIDVDVPAIKDYDGEPISTTKGVMLYRDLSTLSDNSIMINMANKYGVVPYVTKTATGYEDQTSVTSKDYVSLNAKKGLFGNKIYISNDSEAAYKNFYIYIPVVKEGQINSPSTEASDFSLELSTPVDASALEAVLADENDKVEISYAIADESDDKNINPGKDGYTSMSQAEWTSDIPDDLSKITGIKIYLGSVKARSMASINIGYRLSEDKNEVGVQTSYQTFYSSFDVGGETRYPTDIVEKYILEDMSVTGFVWDETGQLPNSVYDEGEDKDQLKAGVSLSLLDKDGAEIVQTAEKLNVTADDGTYTLFAPHDGELIVKLATPPEADTAAWAIVKREVVDDVSINSRAYQDSGKTAVLEFNSNYAREDDGLENINFGIYQMAKLNTDNLDIVVHVGETATASTAIEGNSLSVGDNYTIEFAPASDTSVAEVIASGNKAARVKGLKAGKTAAEVSCTDLYGNRITAEADITAYIRIKYDITANGGTGTASDANMYYVEETTNRLLSMGDALGSSGSLIPNTFIANDGGGVVPPTGHILVGWSTNKDATSETLEIQKGESYSIADNDTTGDIVLYAIYGSTDVVYTIEYYRQISGKTAGIESSYEYYTGGDTQATGVVGATVEAPAGYETKFGNKYKFNADMSSEELQKTIASDGSTVVKLYYDIVKSNNGGGGGSGGGGSDSTGKHAVTPVNGENTGNTDEAKKDDDHEGIVEPKPNDNNYKNWAWGLMPKTGEEAARMGVLLLSIAGLIAIFAALVARRKQRK